MYVKGKRNRKLPLLYAGIFAVTVAVSLGVTAYFGFFGLFLSLLVFAAGSYAAYRLGRYYRIEYEYAVLGGTFSIAVIRSQSSRKKIFSCEIKEIDGFSLCDPAGQPAASVPARSDGPVYLDCTGELPGGGREDSGNGFLRQQYLLSARGEDGKAYRVRIEPDEKILTALQERNFEVRRFFLKNGSAAP